MLHLDFRDASQADVQAIVALLADDVLGGAREDPASPAYAAAFKAMTIQGGRILLAMLDDVIVGCLQLDVLHGLSQQGMVRAQVEGVRIASAHRGQGLGAALMHHAISEARKAGAQTMQLTTNLARTEAQRFYRSLGFHQSHAGLKLDLT